jgi:two-component sensor histidine kinase
MTLSTSSLTDTGLEVLDLHGDAEFLKRRLHVRDSGVHMEGMQRLARAFVERPETILQELVDAAVKLCEADSAGISVERPDKTEEDYYHWIATSGEYAGFLNALLPQHPSACGICLERGRPQLFRVSERFFEIMGVKAATVTDGILLPWQVDGQRGTVWIMAHGREMAFDSEDLKLMLVLAEFAAMGVRQWRQQKLLVDEASAAAAAAMADDLAHKINNPLQSLTNLLYLAAEGHNGEGAREVGAQALKDLQRLSALVKRLLELPVMAMRGGDRN